MVPGGGVGHDGDRAVVQIVIGDGRHGAAASHQKIGVDQLPPGATPVREGHG